MANICYNNLTISGDPKLLKEIERKFIRKDPEDNAPVISFEAVLQTPKALLRQDSPVADPKKAAENRRKYGASDWYEWRKCNWGCRTEALGVQYEPQIESAQIYMTFDTPWDPPISLIEHLAEKYPTLTFELEYEESGNDKKGSQVWGPDNQESWHKQGICQRAIITELTHRGWKKTKAGWKSAKHAKSAKGVDLAKAAALEGLLIED